MNLLALIGAVDAGRFYDPANPTVPAPEPATGFAKLFYDAGLKNALICPWRYVFDGGVPSVGILLETERQLQKYGDDWTADLTLNMAAATPFEIEEMQNLFRETLLDLNAKNFARDAEGVFEARLCRQVSAERNVVDNTFTLEATHEFQFGYTQGG